MKDKHLISEDKELKRRDFLKLGAAAGLGAALAGISLEGCSDKSKNLSTLPGQPKTEPIDIIRIGFVGVGNQGSNHVMNFLKIEGVEIKAICDIIPEKHLCQEFKLNRNNAN